MVEYIALEDEIIGEEDGLVLMVAEPPSRDIAEQLADLQILKGSGFISMLRDITMHPSFCPVKDEQNIFCTGGDSGDDYENLLNAARKAVEHGYRVFLLPNPKGIRTADFIFERKGVYKMFDLKTITGRNSVGNRLKESIGQSNRVLLNITIDYNPMDLARNIKRYFEINKDALEVLVFKGKKYISVSRDLTLSNRFCNIFMKNYVK